MAFRTPAAVASLVAAAVLALPAAAQAAEPGMRNGVGSSATPERTGTVSASTSTRHFITFDTGTSPCGFDSTSPLRDRYAGLGVTMRGPTTTTGGAVLDDCSGFGVRARSGREFLAFNIDFSYADTPEQFRFSERQRAVQMYAANGSEGTATYALTGWRAGTIVARTSVTTTTTGWVLVRVVAAEGMDRVTFRATTPDGSFVVDDLQYTSLF